MTLRARWQSLPRAARWLILAAAFVALYFASVEPALDATARLSLRADALQSALDRQRSTRDDSAALAAARFGDPLLPGGPDRLAALNARVEQVFRERRVSALTIRTRAPIPLGRGSFAGAIPESEQVQRLILDIDFEADPDTAAHVLADLERAPEVAAVSRVSLRRLEKDGRRLVQASLSPEAWIIAPKGGAG